MIEDPADIEIVPPSAERVAARALVLAAVVLEDLMKRHGEELVDRIEAEAKRNERFKWALGVVWLMESTLPPNVLRRVYHASGHRLKVLEWLDRPRTDDT